LTRGYRTQAVKGWLQQVAQTAMVAVCGFDVVEKKTSKPEIRASGL
jgi:hypothetical protein